MPVRRDDARHIIDAPAWLLPFYPLLFAVQLGCFLFIFGAVASHQL